MRVVRNFGGFVLLIGGLAAGQSAPSALADASPPVTEKSATTATTATTVARMKGMMKRQIRRGIEGPSYPLLATWKPLTAREKFRVFEKYTYSPRTFANASINSVMDDVKHSNREYETGPCGVAQRYGIELATSETSVFFERFLIPVLLKQDPRYFRDPRLPFAKRVLYSMSRVLITRSDSGHQTFNASKIGGGLISQAIGDLYVPGRSQGLHPLADRLTFNLARDAGTNLVHEFWPEIRRKIFRH